jgi:alkanesulfonate monooxygenase SsuD/methylene tetrahydromethanopterin reductase-like flavin-dependent oxidoreductase (luciferase family)
MRVRRTPDKVHRIEHRGRFFASRGPLTVVRSPQNGPAIIQAGVSPQGRAFAARFAEAVFAIQPSLEMAAQYYTDVKGRVERAGRDPDTNKLQDPRRLC